MKVRILLFLFFGSFFQLYSQVGSPQVDAGEDISEVCFADGCTVLSAQFVDVGETNEYTVQSIEYDPPFPFDAGEDANLTLDDEWSNVIDLPFTFCFFGETYNSLVVGSNGMISFNTEYAAKQCPYLLTVPNSNIPLTIPESNFNEEQASNPAVTDAVNAIYGAFHDMNIQGGGGRFSYGVVGERPYRSFIVNFDNVSHFSNLNECSRVKTTQQIVIYEATNVIDVYLKDKQACRSFNSGLAVVGIQNKEGTVAYTPPGRNTSAWVATNEAWRFLPSGNTLVDFEWRDESGTVISTEPDFEVCPDETSTYTAFVEFTTCYGETIQDTDEVVVNPTHYPVELNQPVNNYTQCDDESADGTEFFNLSEIATDVLDGNNADVEVVFYASLNDLNAQVNPLPLNYENTSNPQTIFVRGKNNRSTIDCLNFVEATIEVLEEVNYTNTQLFNCSTTSEATFNLTDAEMALINEEDVIISSYHNSRQDALAKTNAIPTNYTGESTLIYVAVTNSIGCESVAELELIVNENPTVQNTSLVVCSELQSANFELTNANASISTDLAGVTISYYETREAANAGGDGLQSSYTSTEKTIFARIEDDNACFSIAEIELLIVASPKSNDIEITECKNENGTILLDLSSYSSMVNNSASAEISYFLNFTDAEMGNSSNQLPNTFEASNNATLYSRTMVADCYVVSEVQLNLIDAPQFNENVILQSCLQQGEIIIKIPVIKDNLILNYPNFAFSFYEDEPSANGLVNEINSDYTVTTETLILVIEDNNTGCSISREIPIVTFDVEVLDNGIQVICQNENFELPNGELVSEPGVYERTIQDSNSGCDILTVTTLAFPEIKMPNTFSPNADNVNDIFRPLPGSDCIQSIKEYKLKIFNRWGEVIFETFDYDTGWNGQNEKQLIQSGIYLWTLNYTINEEDFNQSGAVKIIQ